MTSAAPPQPVESHLVRECEVFCRYLVGREPSSYVAQKYREAHERDARYSAASTFDRVLLRVARLSPFFTHCADSYAAIAARSSQLRRKLVLLVAILESCDASHGLNDQIEDSPAARVVARMGLRGMFFAVRLVLASIIFAPLHFLMAVTGGTRAR